MPIFNTTKKVPTGEGVVNFDKCTLGFYISIFFLLIKTSIKNYYFIWSTKHSFCLTLCKTGLNQQFFTVVVISELGWILLAWPELLVCSWSSARQWLWPPGTWASWTGWDWSCNPEWVLVSQWDVGGYGFGHRCGHLWQEELERSGKYFEIFLKKAEQIYLQTSSINA